jgi:hypothetical protein
MAVSREVTAENRVSYRDLDSREIVVAIIGSR